MNTSKPLKTVESLINKELVKWLDGTKVPGAIVVTDDFTTKLTKKLDAHYYQLMLSLVGDMEYRETLDMGLSSWTGEDYKAFGRNELRSELCKKLSEHFNVEGEV